MTSRYDPRITPWQVSAGDFSANQSTEDKLRFLLRYAVLAPSSHNTQPWKFAVGDSEIRIRTDESRWLKVADSDRRELYISIGCALENLLVAAEHFGYGHGVERMPDPRDATLAAVVGLSENGNRSSCRPPSLFDAIPRRHTNHREYDSRDIPDDALRALEDACVEDGLLLHLTDDIHVKRQVDDLIARADAIQFADPEWRHELGHWLGQGVFGTSWLMSKAGQLAVTYLNMSKQTARKDSELLMSAPVLGVISTEENEPADQVRVGQVFERLSLLATSLGIAVHPMSQILEIEEIREEVAKLIPASNVFPQHTFRLGYAEAEEEHTPRRPLEEVAC